LRIAGKGSSIDDIKTFVHVPVPSGQEVQDVVEQFVCFFSRLPSFASGTLLQQDFGEQPTVQVRKTPEIGVLLVFCEVVKEQWPVEVLVPIFAVIYDFPGCSWR